jgi:hypothetical protein
MCKQGFDDALMFLHRNNLINCTRCLAVQSTFVISETLDESLEFDPECQECKLHRQVSVTEVHISNRGSQPFKTWSHIHILSTFGLLGYV